MSNTTKSLNELSISEKRLKELEQRGDGSIDFSDIPQIDCYPWAWPTEEQIKMFNQLSPDEQINMLRKAIIDGEKSGDSGVLDMEEIKQRAKRKAGLLPEGH